MRRKIVPKPRMWLAKVLCGLALFAVFGYSVAAFVVFEQVAVHVTGTVISVKKESLATGRRGGRVTVERPLVKFTVPETRQEVTAVAKVRSSHAFSAGEPVPLEFQPQDPAATVRVESGLSLLEVAFGVVGGAILLFALGERWRYRRELQGQEAKSVTPRPIANGVSS